MGPGRPRKDDDAPPALPTRVMGRERRPPKRYGSMEVTSSRVAPVKKPKKPKKKSNATASTKANKIPQVQPESVALVVHSGKEPSGSAAPDDIELEKESDALADKPSVTRDAHMMDEPTVDHSGPRLWGETRPGSPEALGWNDLGPAEGFETVDGFYAEDGVDTEDQDYVPPGIDSRAIEIESDSSVEVEDFTELLLASKATTKKPRGRKPKEKPSEVILDNIDFKCLVDGALESVEISADLPWLQARRELLDAMNIAPNDRNSIRLAYRFNDQAKTQYPQALNADKDYDELQALLRQHIGKRLKTMKTPILILNMNEMGSKKKPSKQDSGSSKQTVAKGHQYAISHKNIEYDREEVEKNHKILQSIYRCKTHDRHCYTVAGRHETLSVPQLLTWALKICQGDTDFATPPTLLNDALTARIQKPQKAPSQRQPIAQLLSAKVATATIRPYSGSDLGNSDQEDYPPSFESTEEFLDKLHKSYPSHNYRQYKAKVKDLGFIEINELVDAVGDEMNGADFLSKHISGMSFAAATLFWNALSKEVRTIRKGKGRAI